MTSEFDLEKEIEKTHIWQGQCGCWYSTKARKWPWFYKPHFWFGGRMAFQPISLGGDEWCRRTLVLGVPVTGQIVIPLWYCRGECTEDGWGCSDSLFDGGTWHGFSDPEISAGLKMHRRASELMYDGYVKFLKDIEKEETE